MVREIVSRAIANGDASNPILASVVPVLDDPTKGALIVGNADGSDIGSSWWLVTSLRSILKMVSSLGRTDSSGRQRVVLEWSTTVISGTAGNLLATVSIAAAQTLATVTTVGTLTDMTNIGSNGARVFQNSIMRNTYANNSRSRLSF